MRTLEVVGVRVDAPSGAPVLLLKDVDSSRHLPIWIGAVEASAITSALEGVTAPRPMTHDLFAQVLRCAYPDDVSGHIVGVEDDVFLAELRLGESVRISARPSDVVALVLRLGTRVTCSQELLDQVGVELSAQDQDEVERFREFLESVNADDFEEDHP